MFELLPCGQAAIIENQIDVTYWVHLQLAQAQVVEYCDRADCSDPTRQNNLQKLAETLKCETRHVEELLGVTEETRVEVRREGDRFLVPLSD